MGRIQVIVTAVIAVLLLQLAAGAEVGAAALVSSKPEGNGNFAYRMFGGDDDPGRVSNSVASNYDLFLLSPRHVEIATKIKSINSDAVIYMYKDASSTRFNASDPLAAWCSGGDDTIGYDWGVDYCDTLANHPDWFMTIDSDRFEYDGYQYHWHTDVGATGYKEKWASNVVEDLQANSVWDGVFVDNQLAEITTYTPGSVFPDQYSNMTQGHAAYTNFIDYAASEVIGEGYGIMANMSNARLYDGLWDAYTAEQNAGFDEFWTTFGGTATSANNLGEYEEGWSRQIAESESMGAVGKMGVFSAQTSGGVCGGCAIYGYASYLLANNGQQVFLESNVDNDGIDYLASREMYTWQLGEAQSSRTEILGAGSHLFQREFEYGLALVNASYDETHTVDLERPYINENGEEITSVTLEPLSASILRLEPPETPAEPPVNSGSGPAVIPDTQQPSSGTTTSSEQMPLAPNTGGGPGVMKSALFVIVAALATAGLIWVMARRYSTKMLK